MKFIHCYAGLPGSVDDMRVFVHSGLQQRCTEEFFPQDSHLIGDAAYTIQKNIMVPYPDNGQLTNEQRNFNHTLSFARIVVERSIGLLKGRWRYLLDKLPMTRTDLIPFYIICCCILHNICLMNEDHFEIPIIIPDTIDQEVEPLHVNNRVKQEDINKRNQVCALLNIQ